MKDFARTQMGRRFFENDVPELIRALNKIASNLEQQNIREEKKFIFEQKMAKKNLSALKESTDLRDNVEESK